MGKMGVFVLLVVTFWALWSLYGKETLFILSLILYSPVWPYTVFQDLAFVMYNPEVVQEKMSEFHKLNNVYTVTIVWNISDLD